MNVSIELPVATRHCRDMTEKWVESDFKPEQTTVTIILSLKCRVMEQVKRDLL